ncbi:MAG: serine/threonine protein kinase [Propionibacterium sp.]|nr:serine/threonine protein kinase [Propionibacterium sp.]
MNAHWDESFDEPTIITDMTLDADPTDGYDLLPGPQVHQGQVLSHRYQLESRLSQRGAVQTWKAFDQKLPRSVLVHVVAAHDPRSSGVLDAARHAAAATDSRFLRVLDAVGGEDPDSPSLLVCEFAPGESLTDLLASGPLSALEAAWIVREIADALTPMHEQGLFHQRLSPDSVTVTVTGNVKILGFLIEAALHPEHDDSGAVWSEREAGDVRALGKLLYACLLSMWPVDPARPQAPAWGLPPAPLEGRTWLTPRQVRSSVSPALDAICDRILSPDPRQPGGRLTSASQVAQALSRVLGTADAAADLEQRIRFPVVPVTTSTRAATEAARAAVGDHVHPASLDHDTATDSTAQWDPRQSFTAIAPPPAAPSRGITATHVVGETPGRGARPASPPTPSSRVAVDGGRQIDFRRRRLVFVLVALVLVSLVVGLGGVWLGGRHPSAAASGTTSSSTQSSSAAGAGAYTIASLHDFDPAADGGNNQENPNELGRAIDGNPSTAWQTLTYFNNPRLGGLKPGVGIVIDLGKPEAIGSVKLILQGKPTGVQILVPKGTVTQAPMSSVKDWTVVAQNPAAGTEVSLSPTSAVTSQWVLVYLTSLPKIATARYRGGIAEVSVLP